MVYKRMESDLLDGVPRKVLGHPVKTRTQIVLTCLIPVIFELIVYITLITADIAVTIQHFKDERPFWASLTLAFICLPSVICFISVITSAWHWPEEEGFNKENIKFFTRQVFNLILFPIGAIQRFSRRIFWTIEALFHNRDTYERYHAVTKATENSPFELYHFLQAFTHAGPQIILQIYILLREDLFRNYQTTNAQIISAVFSLITMAVIISSFQRFESQKVVGRIYPWASNNHVKFCKKRLSRTTSAPIIRQQSAAPSEYPDVLRNFKTLDEDDEQANDITKDEPLNFFTGPSTSRKTLNVNEFNFDKNVVKNIENQNFPWNISDDEKYQHHNTNKNGTDVVNELSSPDMNFSYDTVDDSCQNKKRKSVRMNIPLNRQQSTDSNTSENIPDDDLIENIDEIKKFLRKTDGDHNLYNNSSSQSSPAFKDRTNTINFDIVPNIPPPPTPSINKSYFNRISTFKDKIVYNTELYIKEHVPRLPPNLFDHNDSTNKEINNDEIDGVRLRENSNQEDDIILPTRKELITGIEQDDFIGKFISFLGWMLFLLMRMLSLSVFSVFYIEYCVHLLYSHYILMVLCLFWETKLQEKIERIYFYLFLGYVYIFSILEFKIKFVHIRTWYAGYIGLLYLENILITVWWFKLGDYHSWWFNYLFIVIMASGILSLSCFIFYYFILKPKVKILFVN